MYAAALFEPPMAIEEFRAWILTTCLRELVESLAHSLESARQIGVAIGLVGESLTPRGVVETINANRKRFHRWGLPEKLGHLREDLSIPIPAEVERSALTLNAARNCLAHRGGMISPGDANCAGGLRVSWLKLQLLAVGPHGARPFEIPGATRAGESLNISRVEAERVFSIGTQLAFSEGEFVEIATSFWLLGTILKETIADVARAAGMPVNIKNR